MSNTFFWGAATSAHQVEGNTHNDWSEWEKVNARRLSEKGAGKYPPENFISGRACDQYNRFREDFDIAKSLGHNAHRFSIEWSRIEPEEGKFNKREIQHYRDVVAALRERGIEPLVTLWHWTIPIWLRDKGGVESKEFPVYFARYVEKIISELKPRRRTSRLDVRRLGIKFWIILNETNVYSTRSYLLGHWPPMHKSFLKYLKVNENLRRAHVLAYEQIKKHDPGAFVGIAESNVFYEAIGMNPWNRFLKTILEYFWNRHFLDNVKDHLDFIGINYYSHNRIRWRMNRNENKMVSDMGWDLYPDGLYHVLKNVAARYKKPIYITENGIADAKDEKRAIFILNHTGAMRQAMKEGVDVRGYFYWSLLDNFEWADGFWPRFGLVDVDYNTLERKIRKSAYVYKQIIGENNSLGLK